MQLFTLKVHIIFIKYNDTHKIFIQACFTQVMKHITYFFLILRCYKRLQVKKTFLRNDNNLNK